MAIGFDLLHSINGSHLLDRILEHVDPTDWESCRLVCRRWEAHIRSELFRRRPRTEEFSGKVKQLIWAKERPLKREIVLDAEGRSKRLPMVAADGKGGLLVVSGSKLRVFKTPSLKTIKEIELSGYEEKKKLVKMKLFKDFLVSLQINGDLATFNSHDGHRLDELSLQPSANTRDAAVLPSAQLLTHSGQPGRFTAQHFKACATVFEVNDFGKMKVLATVIKEGYEVLTLDEKTFLLHAYDPKANNTKLELWRLVVDGKRSFAWEKEEKLPRMKFAVFQDAELHGDVLKVTGKTMTSSVSLINLRSGETVREPEQNFEEMLGHQNQEESFPENKNERFEYETVPHLWKRLLVTVKVDDRGVSSMRTKFKWIEKDENTTPRLKKRKVEQELAYDEKGIYLAAKSGDHGTKIIAYDFERHFDRYGCH